ncbi:EamA family transporter [Sulfodiicoccus acidiphilus]|uniref:EamA family transporter n=1 Tax=Sulfodiicoccus acidiphilus TaxID=1670455 RepID=A0A348B451_9CREN|nr:DMT family transporter [Sulfodiicoccus acidiphilus]BBD72953.1 EamA family transporter [Sulfodiicoccus acidiphilus]GGT87760.1 EamA family transporter [Sulfodiicoccus acidiphilus]
MRVLRYLVPYVLISTFQYYFAKDALNYAAPFPFMAMRYLISAAIMYGIARKLIWNREVLILSLLTVTSSSLWAYGLIYVTPAQSAVLSYSMPLFSLPIAYLVIKEKPERIETMGLVVGLVGVLIYGIPLAHGFTLIGSVLTIVNAVFWAAFTVYYRKLMDYDPISLNASQFVVGSIPLVGLSLITPHVQFTGKFLGDLLFTSVLGGAVGFFLWNSMVRTEKVAKVTIMSFSVPIFATVAQVVEALAIPSVYTVTGIGTMFVGIVVSRLKGGIAKVRGEERRAKAR